MTKPTLLEQIQQDLSKIEPADFQPPRDPVQPGDKTLGQANDHVSALYTLFMRYALAASQQRNTLEFGQFHSDDEEKAAISEARRLAVMALLVQKLLLAEASHQFEAWSETHAPNIRKGWEVVIPTPNPLHEFLGKLGYPDLHSNRQG